MTKMIKNSILALKKLLLTILSLTRLARIQLYDFNKFRKHYSVKNTKNKNKEQLKSWILQDKHRVEKALSLESVRPNFGEAVFKRLYSHLSNYAYLYEKDDVYYWGIGVFESYKQHHDDKKIELDNWFKFIYSKIDRGDLKHSTASAVGVSPYATSNLNEKEFKDFFNSRASVRNFDPKQSISKDTLESIVSITTKTPSVCNRQHWKVHFASGELKNKVLSLQNGNTGFGHNAPQVAIVTSSLKAFYLPAERHQAYTDGGMFAMSFLLACHAYDVQTCALNWAASLKQDIELRKLNIIEDDEVVIMLVVLGKARKGTVVAKSPRKDGSQIAKFH